MNIDYDHSRNLHTNVGPEVALPFIFANGRPRSLLDVGCGLGLWLRAASDLGVPDIFGVDGVEIAPDKFLIPKNLFLKQDLTKTWTLGRHFDAALCLEVGEHLDEAYAATLVDSLTAHSDLIYFSAACPGQAGQHHVNCQWPSYWQNLFNKRNFACSDAVRWTIWDNKSVEWWYRQNLFSARKDPRNAGTEPRIPGVLHPDANELIARFTVEKRIKEGRMSLAWYARVPFLALKNKLVRLCCGRD